MIRFGRQVFLGMVILVFSASAQPVVQRTANTTLQLPQFPPIQGFTVTNTFENVPLFTPFCVASPPGETNRLFILEKAGRVVVITNLANPTRTVFLDITDRVLSAANEEGLLGIAFHPGYATNRNFYLFFTGEATTTNADHSLNVGRHECLSLFRATAGNTNQALSSTEVPLIRQIDRDTPHNAGDIHFGPDGYLYASLGDEGGGFDSYNNSQHIDLNFFSGIIRIDVDKRSTNRLPNVHPASTTNYYVPKDNPFVGATTFNGSTVNSNNVRSEFWCVGLRNPWRFTFDPTNGKLLCADVGQEHWEEINVINKGGNYGWSFREGSYDGPKSDNTPAGFTSVIPLLQYPHGTAAYEGNAVIGGVVYSSNRIPQLTNSYVFGDHISGNIWQMRYSGTNVTQWQRICYETPTSFGIDPSNGDVLIVKHTENVIKRLIYITNSIGTPLPPTLDQTGAFSNLLTLQPNAGVVPFDVNAPFWSDNGKKTRWFSLPNTNATFSFNAESNWAFPTGTVWIKHFDLELTNGVPSSAQRIETRFLVRNSNGVYGVTYRWGGSSSNATLVADEGMDENFTIYDNGTPRIQTWHYPSRFECQICHNNVGGWALGFNTHQLNRDFNYGGTVTNQLRALAQAGYFSAPISNFVSLRALVNPTNATYSLDYRVHSYLAANCVHCHQPGGVGLGYWDARISTPLSAAGVIDGQLANGFGIENYRVIAPGSPGNSILLQRIGTLDTIRMPPLASHLINTQIVNLISNWVNTLTNYETFPAWQMRIFGSTNSLQAAANADPDKDGANNYFEFLTGTSPLNVASVWKSQTQKTASTAQIVFPQIANRGFEVQYSAELTPVLWQSLDRPDNRAWFAATNLTGTVSDLLTNNHRFYRVRVLEP